MQTKENFITVLILMVVCVITPYVDGIDPVCFNCHCSSYELDRSIRCKNAVTDKTSYFKLWTENTTIVVGSDVVLAVELKEHANDYCWCTSAKLEWNGLLQNSSGRLLTTHIMDATKAEMGYYWAVIYLDDNFFFSKPVFLNVTGPDEITPSPPMKVDPKVGAIVVGSLFVVIMFFGISIHCWKMHKKSLRDRERKKLFNNLESEAHVPLTWDLQHPANFIQESAAEHPAYGPEPLPASDLEEEGSVSTKSGGSATFSKSLSSDDEKGTAADSKTPVKAVQPVQKEPLQQQQEMSPRSSPRTCRNIALQVPIKDDRFTNQRSWYKSLNTEVVSESLLSNKDHEARKAAKKHKESLTLHDKSLAQGLLMCADITSDRLERIKEAHKYITATGYSYGRSLPTPQPAGARPTVMTIFPTATPMTYKSRPGGATIHTSNPERRRHVGTLFSDDTMSKTRSVQFSHTSLLKRYNSVDNLKAQKPSDNVPKKSNLKNNGVLKNAYNNSRGDVEVDGNADHYLAKNSGSLSADDRKPKKSESSKDKGHKRTMSVPKLGLTPASPVTPSRFTVKLVDSKDALDGDEQPSTLPTDPLLQHWDFSSADSVTRADGSGGGSKSGSRQRMDHLRVPGY